MDEHEGEARALTPDELDMSLQMLRVEAECDRRLGPELTAQIDAMPRDQLHQVALRQIEGMFPGQLLCGAAHLAQQIDALAQLCGESGPAMFMPLLNKLCNDILVVHATHHAPDDAAHPN